MSAKKTKYGILLGCAAAVLAAVAAAFLLCAARLDLNGSDRMELAVGEEYREKGASARLFGIDLTGRVQVSGAVDASTPGSYEVRYKLEGFAWVPEKTRTVIVRDITIPELRLMKGEHIQLELGAAYAEPGYTASDNLDGDLTSRVQAEGTVDVHTPGEYRITYSVSDSSGNQAKAERLITVRPRSPLTMSIADFTLDEYFSGTILPQAQDAGQEYIDETIFIGDSITENASYYKYLPYGNIWAKSGINVEDLLTTELNIYGGIGGDGRDEEMTAVEAAEKARPKRALITIGSNEVFRASPEQFRADYQAFLKAFQKASPETLIIVSSIYPVDKAYDLSPNTAYTTNNDKCNKLNYALAEMCRDNGWKFLNVAEAMKDENGWAKEGALYDSDKIHPKAETYEVIVSYIRTHPYFGE